MDGPRGFPPVTAARSAGTELARPSANVTQNKILTTSPVEGRRRTDSNFDDIRQGLRRFVSTSVQTEPAPRTLDFSFNFPSVVPLSSLPNHVTCMAPRQASPAPSSTSSRASSRSRDELRADMRRVVPPSDTPHSNYQVTSGKFWPRDNVLDKRSRGHSRNSSTSSTTTTRSTSSNLSTVPELSPSKSESQFDTTSTRGAVVNFAIYEDEDDNDQPKKQDNNKERSLYGPLEIDESCFSWGSSSSYSRAPDVAWTTTTKDDPMLFDNVLGKANAIFCGDEQAMFHNQIHEPSAAELRARARKAEKLRLKREKERRDWARVKGWAVDFAVEVNAANEQKRAERVAAQEVLRAEYAVAARWREGRGEQEGLQTPPGSSHVGSMLSAMVKEEREREKEVARGSSAGSACASDDGNSAWETCENSPVGGSPIKDASVENEQTKLPGPAMTNTGIESAESGEDTTHGVDIASSTGEDDGDDCAIESCSTICQSAGGRRYW